MSAGFRFDMFMLDVQVFKSRNGHLAIKATWHQRRYLVRAHKFVEFKISHGINMLNRTRMPAFYLPFIELITTPSIPTKKT